MTTSTTHPAPDLRQLTAAFGAVCDRLPADAWARPSPCEGWTARDVVRHVVDTERDFLDQRGVPLAPIDLGGDPAAVWRTHAAALADALADPAVGGLEYDGHFGRTTVAESLLRFYGFDLVVHRWDVATAAGLDERFTDQELAFVEACAAGFGETLYTEGICRPALDVPADTDRQTRVLALVGRRAAG
ncbi:TIGR03086 family metal-binding protein [Cellulomonas dongxiuzhuiae]|uniref:TIGR03086 family protein n=1 Tax=Cellulomonas dongxiuzhuiae TaxID=2819979 RepID=A0ABX8GJ33_9CELL|nr:TIGR03086 family metal-binding protein [Cellulomonas dongxiuzhuiae]MBO3094820.1 TIGR03086 family protein [Cellulomonas dongxiuzhuiae]QWC15853.1 TIGR03086 family protein [Cellulomonas dongxiuzhuiae]